MSLKPRVAVCLRFDGEAEQAAELYTSLIPDSEITNTMRMAEDQPALMVEFTLNGVPFQALNGGPEFKRSDAASISVTTQDQQETDQLWNALIADGGSEGNCAWLKDKFGVSWQIVPAILPEYLSAADKAAAERVMQVMMGMNKIIIAELDVAFNGN